MTQPMVQAARLIRHISPQLLLSALMITAFSYAFDWPASIIPLHLLIIAAVQCLFFCACGWGLRFPVVSGSRMAPRGYAFALFVIFLAINPIYLASFSTNLFWSENLTPANLGVVLPHLTGLRQSFGYSVFIIAGLVVVQLSGIMLLFLRSSRRLFDRLRQTFPDNCSSWPAYTTTMIFGLAAASAWWLTPAVEQMVRMDPILSFWSSRSTAVSRFAFKPKSRISDFKAQKAYPLQPEFRRRNVLIIIVDCMRADHLPLYGYHRNTTPYLANLTSAGRVQKVDFSISVGNDSPQGIFGILGSHYAENQFTSNFMIQDVLSQLGYRTHLIAAGDHTASVKDIRAFYGDHFDLFSDGLARRSFTVNDDRGIIESLEQIPDHDTRPAFFFFHLMSAHTLSVRDPQYGQWQPAILELEWGRIITGKMDPVVMTNTYDNGLLQADDMIRRIFTLLEAKGYLRDYICVITGDHGEGLGEHGNFGHTRFLYQEDINVPILILDSDQPAPTPLPFASQVDIAPTLLKNLGLPLPDNWDGFPIEPAGEKRFVFVVSRRPGQWGAVLRYGDGLIYKYLFYGWGREDFHDHLYELTSDPGEAKDIIKTAPPSLLAEIKREAAHHYSVDTSK